MPQITLPDNSKRSYDQPISIDEVSRDIGSGLAKATVAGKINGKLVDASETITEDCKLQIVTIEDNEGLEIVRALLCTSFCSCFKTNLSRCSNGYRSCHQGWFLLRYQA